MYFKLHPSNSLLFPFLLLVLILFSFFLFAVIFAIVENFWAHHHLMCRNKYSNGKSIWKGNKRMTTEYSSSFFFENENGPLKA